ncbi:MAG: hypothetical protein F6K11_23395 [Leptolyngbya sp. SIO3F4]|nr:hypothetical protein [Leptolyngbya sp. SIO3F4]
MPSTITLPSIIADGESFDIGPRESFETGALTILGSLYISRDEDDDAPPGSLRIYGTTTVDDDGALRNAGELINSRSGDITVKGDSQIYNNSVSSFRNSGTVTITERGEFYSHGSLVNYSTGNIFIDTGTSFRSESGTIDNDGVIHNNSSDDDNFELSSGVVLTGSGIYRGRTLKIDKETFRPDGFTVETDFNLNSNGILEFVNPGTTPLLTVTGAASLSGGSLIFDGLENLSEGSYTLIDGQSTLTINNGLLDDVDSHDTALYDYELVHSNNDLILTVDDLTTANDPSNTDTVPSLPVIEGTDGSDQLTGGNDAERLMGYRGRDILLGGNGDDVLDGGRGHDILVGGNGDDTLIGGAGQDTFVFNSDQGIDTITDFTDQDHIFIDASELGGVIIINPVYNSSTGELSVIRQTIETQITYQRFGSLRIPIPTTTLVSENITLAVLESPTGFNVSTDVTIG